MDQQENRNYCLTGCHLAADCAEESCQRAVRLQKRSLDEYLGVLKAVAFNAKSALVRRDDDAIEVMDPSTGKHFRLDTDYLTDLGKKSMSESCSMNNHGQQMCSPDRKGFYTCVYNKWAVHICGAGTTCHGHPTSNSHILCH